MASENKRVNTIKKKVLISKYSYAILVVFDFDFDLCFVELMKSDEVSCQVGSQVATFVHFDGEKKLLSHPVFVKHLGEVRDFMPVGVSVSNFPHGQYPLWTVRYKQQYYTVRNS